MCASCVFQCLKMDRRDKRAFRGPLVLSSFLIFCPRRGGFRKRLACVTADQPATSIHAIRTKFSGVSSSSEA